MILYDSFYFLFLLNIHYFDYENNNEKYFAHEIDGFGNFYFMDEPGYPNLISLPFFNFCSNNDEIYLNTRKRIL